MAPFPPRRAGARAPVAVSLLLLFALALPGWLGAQGSGTLFPSDTTTPFRANIEWRTSVYGSADSPEFSILRRTLIKVYAEAGEHLLMGSSAVGIGSGDIRVYNPNVVTGAVGQETVPALAGTAAPAQPGAFANGFSCQAQRTAIGGGARGQIRSRAAELAGPNSANNLLPAGYAPCVYTAPAAGIYNVVFVGPSGFSSDAEPTLTGSLVPTTADLGTNQRTSTTIWDISVRKDLNTLAVEPGRAFTFYLAGNSGGGGRNVVSEAVVVTDFGFRYRVRYDGDPYGFIVYSNQLGFRNTDGAPLYHNILADPTAAEQDQNQLKELQGGVQLLPPEYPLFFDEPYGPALDALGIPRTPIVPAITGFTFVGSAGDNSTLIDTGGTFTFQTSQVGVFAIVISRDGQNFDPDAPQNKLIRGVAAAPGPLTVPWDGRDNSGEPFPVGEYRSRAAVQGGEVHFPFLDVENNTLGGPTVQLLNPPDINNDGVGDCPPWNGGCYGAFYNDGGYRTAPTAANPQGTLIGTAVGGPLCPGNAQNPRGFGNPPQTIKSDSVLGYDSRTPQRAFGFPFGANPEAICLPNGGFGDKKALDLWTYYPSNNIVVPLRIFDRPTAVTLRSFSAAADADGVTVSWETGSEIGTAGFHLLRAPSADRSAAVRVTPELILARGSTTQGAAYSWRDATAAPGVRYSYWLEELETSGATNVYGPATVGPALGSGGNRVMLPLVRR
jgi:hypothetical protein